MDWIDLACEFRLDGEIIRGEILDLSHTGFVVATNVRFELGQEFELRLVGGSTQRPLYVRGVAESRVAHGAQSHPGVRFRLLKFSTDYSRLIAGADAPDDTDAFPSRSNSPIRGDGEREWLTNLLGLEVEPSPRPPDADQESGEWEEYSPLPERAGTPLFREDSLAPEAIIIDDGELDDVARVLSELGVRAERRAPDGDFTGANWVGPQKLLVVTANRALKLRLPLQSMRRDFVSIAVADSDARMMCSALRRLGFDYTISRPIHPLAMSMLLRQAIFTDDDQRVAPREVLGCLVQWWCGWQPKHPGVILDVSASGCQLLVRGSLPRRSEIKISVPDAMAGGGFTLAGRVVRTIPGPGDAKLGISFDPLSDKVQAKLQRILALPGPCRLIGHSSLLEADVARAASANAPLEEPKRDRRLNARSAMNQEVVALEHGSTQVKHVLVSSDLSIEGMRVEYQPSLCLEEHLDLALYEDNEHDPLILSAVVARDDGRAGLWLRFVGVKPEIQDRLARALDRFPPVTRLDHADTESGRVVLGQILACNDGCRSDDSA